MRIRAVTFDFWNTLFRDANGEARQRMRIDAFSEATGVSPEAVSDAMNVVWKEFDRVHRQEQRTLRPEDAVRLAAGILGVEVPWQLESELSEVFATAILAYSPEPIEGALEAVRAVANGLGSGLPVGIISDTGVSPGRVLRHLLDRGGFGPLFGGMAFSDEVGVSKPQMAMYEEAARQLGVQACELLHIGDLERTDVAGAKAVGGAAILFTGAGGGVDGDVSTQADYVFRSWRDFVDALPSIVRAD